MSARAIAWEPRAPFREEMYASSPGHPLAFRPLGNKWLGMVLTDSGPIFSTPLTWRGMRDWLTGCGVDVDQTYDWSPLGQLTSVFDVYGGARDGSPATPFDAAVRVYFIQCGTTGPVKIGMARDVRKRMATLQTACPFDLRLLAAIDGSADLERELHQRFAEHRLRGEWFLPVPELLAHVQEVAS